MIKHFQTLINCHLNNEKSFLCFINALNQANLHREILFPQLISVKEGQIQGA